jgi:hypothetical protein
MIAVLQTCFDHLAVFNCPVSEVDQRHALKQINSELNAAPFSANCKKIIVAIGDDVRAFRRMQLTPKECQKRIELKLSELGEIVKGSE